MTNINELRRYVVKGAAGAHADSLVVDPDIGVLGDRQYGLQRKPKTLDTWAPKATFYVAMNSPVMPTQSPSYDAVKPHSRNGVNLLADSYLEYVAAAHMLTEPPSVLNTHGEFNLTDTNGSSVSFLNLASLRELQKFMGCHIDPYRFRMNVHLEGLMPFEELTWVDSYPGTRVIQVGEVKFRVDDACERCKAVEANPNPVSIGYDLKILEALDELMRSRDYPGSPHRNTNRVMGILACPLSHGTINVGDLIIA